VSKKVKLYSRLSFQWLFPRNSGKELAIAAVAPLYGTLGLLKPTGPNHLEIFRKLYFASGIARGAGSTAEPKSPPRLLNRR